jgi:3-hydroxyisobutyrate dehydrogenase-like beta-hydroxyacid dehydrogenase
VWNRTASRSSNWIAEFSGAAAASPAAAVDSVDAVFVCTGNDDDLRSVALGKTGALAALAPGATFVDHTTVSSELARELAREAESRGLHFLDAPVSGGQVGAENGALTIMIGGSEETFENVRPLLDCYAKRAVLMGPAGSGQLTKMVNQICIAGLLQGLSESLDFARRVGLDGAKAVEVISGGAAQSWQMDNRALTMLEEKFDFGFAVDWMRKDLDIALAEGKRAGAELPVTAMVNEFYKELQKRGGGRKDTSSLIERLG